MIEVAREGRGGEGCAVANACDLELCRMMMTMVLGVASSARPNNSWCMRLICC